MIAAFDQTVDRVVEPWRGRPSIETAARVVSNLADYGFAWSLVAATKGRRRGPRRVRAARGLAVSGTLSAVINAGIKQVVDRGRPAPDDGTPSSNGAAALDGRGTDTGGGPLWVRPPRSSSFPSGHTLAACCTAVVLAETPAQAATYLVFGAAVGTSRVYLRAHHASDVLGGAVIGVALGLVARRVVDRDGRHPRCPTETPTVGE